MKKLKSNLNPNKIKEARESAGLTQTQAAELIGAKLRTWQDWEYGKRNMPLAKWELFNIKTKK